MSRSTGALVFSRLANANTRCRSPKPGGLDFAEIMESGTLDEEFFLALPLRQ